MRRAAMRRGEDVSAGGGRGSEASAPPPSTLPTIDPAWDETAFASRPAPRRAGKLDAADAKAAFDEIVEVVGFGMPAGGGFSAGLLAGLRQG